MRKNLHTPLEYIGHGHGIQIKGDATPYVALHQYTEKCPILANLLGKLTSELGDLGKVEDEAADCEDENPVIKRLLELPDSLLNPLTPSSLPLE